MNLTKLFETQKLLDERIEKEHPRLEGEDRLAKKILALQVELGELANEWRGFKYWSEDREPRVRLLDRQKSKIDKTVYKNPLLEEYVDCLHFILSIGLELNFDKEDYEFLHKQNIPIYKSCSGITEQFNSIFLALTTLNYDNDLEFYEELFLYFISLGEMLGFTWDQIEQAYYEKNKVNHERQDNQY